MSQSDEQLAQELTSQLGQTGLKVAATLDGEPEVDPSVGMPAENPLETDFFKAINAYRAAKHGGDADKIAQAEAALREVVRDEMICNGC